MLTGFAYAILMYYRNRKHPFNAWLTFLLGALRFILVSLIALLLLHPYWMHQLKIIEQPVIVLAHDNSASMVIGPDSSQQKALLPQRYDTLIQALSKDYLVDAYTFDSDITKGGTLDFSGQQTDISKVFYEINTAYYKRNVGAVVLLSDGISNKGIPPDLIPHTNPFTIFTVGMGDTIIRPDIRITDLRHNKIVYKESSFPVELSLKAQKAAGKSIEISVFLNGKKLASSSIQILKEQFTYSQTFQLEAAETGQNKLVVEISGLENEFILENNKRESYLEVLDERLEILVLARAPHPDIAAIRAALGESHQLNFEFIQNWKPQNKNYGLLILHELPAAGINHLQLESYLEAHPSLAVWTIVGSNTDLGSLNKLQKAVQFKANGRGTMDILPIAEPNFSLFSLEKFQLERLNRFPALYSPLLDLNLPMNHNSLLYQRIRSAATNYPLFGFANYNNRRFAYTTGTGLWRWRMADYSQNGNHETFNTVISKAINYLMVKTDTRRLRLFSEASYLMNDEIQFRAELYNPALELVNEPDVYLLLTNTETNTSYEYLFSRNEDAYQLNAGRLPSGLYTYRSETILGNEKLSFEGEFVVTSTSAEIQESVADHAMLKRIAAQNGGSFIHGNNWKLLPKMIQDNVGISSTASFQKDYSPLISLIWLPLVLLILVTIEWLLRKAYGSY